MNDSSTQTQSVVIAPYYSGKRLFDFLVSAGALALLALPMAAIAGAIRATSPGPAIYWSSRVGASNKLFKMPKFRTMRIDTPAVATHLLEQPEQFITPVGGFLRRTSLDELPQLWSVLCGDMSLVGPRPALDNQDDLIAMRTGAGVHGLRPGITGWAQINGRDEIPIPQKVALDHEYLQNFSFAHDLRIIMRTIIKVAAQDGITH